MLCRQPLQPFRKAHHRARVCMQWSKKHLGLSHVRVSLASNLQTRPGDHSEEDANLQQQLLFSNHKSLSPTTVFCFDLGASSWLPANLDILPLTKPTMMLHTGSEGLQEGLDRPASVSVVGVQAGSGGSVLKNCKAAQVTEASTLRHSIPIRTRTLVG